MMIRTRNVLACCAIALATTTAWAQSPRIFLVEAGGNAAGTREGQNIPVVAQPGTTIAFDIYAEMTGGGSVDVTGFELHAACTPTGGDGPPVNYAPDSVQVTGANFFACGIAPFTQRAPGNCPSSEPGGLSAASPGDSCLLGAPVLIGSISYEVPPGAATYDPSGNPYVITIVDQGRSFITDSGQTLLPNLILDGANVTIPNGQCCDLGNMECVPGSGSDGQMTEEECDDLDPDFSWTEGKSCLDECICELDEHCDDGYTCTEDRCDPDHPDAGPDGCVYAAVHTRCNDDNDNDCTEDTCDPDDTEADPVTGCVLIDMLDGTECDDGLYCNVGEMCTAGDCGGGGPRDCDDGVGCTDDSCNEGTDSCDNITNDANCDNALWCDGPETCDPVLDCQPGTLPCDDEIDCTTDPCNEFLDECEAPVPHDALCDDGDVCTGVETCNPATGDQVTGCLAGVDPDCDDGNPCTADSCDPVEGCKHAFEPIDTPCENGMWCDGDETCDGAGTCRPGTIRCDDGIACTSDPCNEADDMCEPPFPHDELCDDGVGCTNDTCDLVNDCQFMPDDSKCDDGNPCTVDSCDPTGGCTHEFEPAGTFCSNGLWCDGDETCDGTGICQSGTIRCDDGIACTSDPCNEADDVCESPFPHDELCDDGVGCTNDTCDLVNDCQFAPDDSNCDDGVGCTNDTCDLTKDCQFTPDDSNCKDEFDCTDDTCDLVNDCQFTPNDSKCDNAQFCDGAEICDPVRNPVDGCIDGTLPCDDGIDCTNDCDEIADVCRSDPDPIDCGNLDLTLHAEDGCFTSGQDVCVTVDASNLDGQAMVGGQFFINFDACLLEFVAMSPGDHPELGIAPCVTLGESPFSSEIFERVRCCDPNDPASPCDWAAPDPCRCIIEYAVGLPLGGLPSAADNTMATIHFRTIVPYPNDLNLVGQGDGEIAFDPAHDCENNPATATQLSDYLGSPNCPQPGSAIPITVDDNAPVFGDNAPDFNNRCDAIGPIPNDPGKCSAAIGVIPCGVEDKSTSESSGCGLCDLRWSRSDGRRLNEPYDVGTTCITWVATDCAGNEASHEQCVTVVDGELPTIDCPPDVNVTAATGRCEADVDPGMATCTDNCDCEVTCQRDDGKDCWNDMYPVGTTTLTWTATDPAGNTNTCQQVVTVSDDEPPTIDCPPDKNVPAGADRCDANVDPGRATCTDNCGDCSVACQRSDGLDCVTDRYPIGDTILTWTATDPSGNSSTCEQKVTVEDRELPRIEPMPDIKRPNDLNQCHAVVTWDDPIVSDNCPGVTWVCVPPSGSMFDVGETTVTCTATDVAVPVNTSEVSFVVTVNDVEFPSITCPADKAVATDPGECTAIIDPGMAQCTDNCACTVSCVRDDGLDCWSDPYPPGTTTLTWTATDTAGNTASCQQTITVSDNEPPGVTCPPDKNVPAEPGQCGAAVDPGMATCTDNCGCVAPPTCRRSDGLDCFTDRYPVGCTTLTWCASDDAGIEACCDQTVCVIDTQEPTIICPEDVEAQSADRPCGVEVNYPDPVVDDNCPGVTWACAPPSGSFFDVGDTLVVCTARDAAENASKCPFTVTVNDDKDPSITCTADVEVSTDPDECSARVYPSDTSSEDLALCTDNCSCAIVCERDDGLALGAPYPLGTTEICCTAEDSSLNADGCCFTVTVIDTEDPVIDCQDLADITVNADSGECEAVVDPGSATCTDNCDCDVVCVRNDGLDCWSDPYPVGTTTLTWCAKDNADPANENCCPPQTITVNEVTDVVIVMRSEAALTTGTCERCISFALFDCATGQPAPPFSDEHRVITFRNGLASETLVVPCGPWYCISAKDELHVLQSTVSLAVSGGHFVADFTGDNRLLCGDADNDNVVDINDYAILFTQYLDSPPLPTTKCEDEFAGPPPPYHTDFDCDGRVTTGDFLCILFNFLKFGDEVDACCPTRAFAMSGTDRVGGPETPAGVRGGDRVALRDKRRFRPRTAEASISVEDIATRIGMEAAMAADIDGNGVLDVADMALFSQGRSIELPERFKEIMLERATRVEDVTPARPRR